MNGIVSALGIGSSGILAAGTFSRWVGLYDSFGRGDTVAIFPMSNPSTTISEEEKKQQGTGITQVLWTPCGRYLCVVERGSDGIGIWDVRVTGKNLAWLAGRNAKTNQRLGVDLIGDEIWAGGLDGLVKIWSGFTGKEGIMKPGVEFHAHDGM